MKRKRFVAIFLDFVIITFITKIFWSLFDTNDMTHHHEWFRFIKFWVIGLAYFTLLEGIFYNASLGKLAVGVKVVSEDGNPVKLWIIPIRYFLFVLLMPINLFFMIFVWNIGFFHDNICKTKVVLSEE